MDNEEFSELEEIETSELPSVDPVKVLLNMKDETSKGVLLNCVTMFMSSNIPLMILNQNLNVVYISEPLRTMLGGMYKDLTLPFTTLFARAFTTELMKEFYEAIHNPDEKFSWKGTIQHKSNTMVGLYTKITAIPVLVKNNTPTGYLIIFEDITAEKKKTLKSIYKSILEASRLKDNETGAHNERVNHYAKCLARKLKETGKYPQIDPDFINDIGFLAGMHDVGKIGTPDEILKKNNVDVAVDFISNLGGIRIYEAVIFRIVKIENMSDEDTKVEELIKVIQNKQSMQNNKVMVFSSFRHTLRYLHEKLSSRGIRVGIIHGGVKDDERVALRNRFKSKRELNDSIDVLLFSEVGCEGLDYQFCDCLINYDLPWNPQAIEQRIGRIDRNGQKSESISIINIITEGTIDCDIYDRCLSRIGVFNSSIGDSEEILGEVTQEIYNIVEKYILKPKERAQKELQLADNAIRKMQEQQHLEEEKHAFFGLDLSEEVMKKEMQEATNIHLSAQAIAQLVETYLEKRLGADKQYILGEGTLKTLRLNAENRNVLLTDFSALDRQANPVYKAWENYLTNKTAFEKITFDGEYATEHQDTTFIMPTHPLVKQAINCFADDPVQCNLAVKTTELPVGKYPFIVYEWQYKGVKPNNELVVITSDNIDSNLMLRLIYGASDFSGEPYSTSYDELEQLHFAVWKAQKEEYLMEAQQIIMFKLESLVSSQQGQVRAIQNQLSKITNERIKVMRQGQLERLEQVFKDKQADLQTEIDRCDIIATKLATGILHVEN